MAASAKSLASAGEARGEPTRAALFASALDLFGAKGFDAASTRAIAAAAGANVASIAYHFGGKEGLRLACADHVVDTIPRLPRPALRRGRPAAPPDARGGARASRARIVEAIVGFVVVRPRGAVDRALRRARDVRAAVAFERIYAGAFAPMHERFCAIWAVATGAEADGADDAARHVRDARPDPLFPPRAPRRAAPARLARHRSRARPSDSAALWSRISTPRSRRPAGGPDDSRSALCSIGFVASWLSACAPADQLRRRLCRRRIRADRADRRRAHRRARRPARRSG